MGVAWTGNSYPSGNFFTSRNGRLSFPHPRTHSVTAVNAIARATRPLNWAQWEDNVVILSTAVTDEPILYITR